LDFKSQVKASVDIVGLVGEYVRLKRVGSTQSYIGLCPFHTEKTPSFRVHANHQFYKCFGCGQGGDDFKFVQEIERITFYEALKQLAERSGIPPPKRSEFADADTKLRAAILQMHELAEQAFRASLKGSAGAEARSYLDRRGVAAAEIEHFGLGYSERTGHFLTNLFQKHDFPADHMEQSGLVMRRDGGGLFDRFRNRLMFPIHNESGKVIGFGGRALSENDQPKYMNSPETPIYKKSYVLYNLHRAKEGIRKEDRVVLVEGYMDAIGVYMSGVKEVVASCGTALTTQQVQAMKRHSGRIVVNFDPDAAGSSATEKSLQILLEEGMHVRVLELEGGLDPDEYCKEQGATAYGNALTVAKNYFYWLADRARSKYDMRTAEGRVAAFQFLLPAIQRLTDKIERSAVAGDVAGYLGVDSGLVLENFRKAATDRREKTLAAPVEPIRHDEKILLNLFLSSEEARGRLIPELRGLAAVDQFATRRIFQALFALYDAGAPFGLAELDARLEEADRSRLASIALGDETKEEDFSLQLGVACLEKLQRQTLEGQILALKASIKDAERAGNLAEALRLNEELHRFEKSQRAGGTMTGNSNPRVDGGARRQ
jgi:DNA primase